VTNLNGALQILWYHTKGQSLYWSQYLAPLPRRSNYSWHCTWQILSSTCTAIISTLTWNVHPITLNLHLHGLRGHWRSCSIICVKQSQQKLLLRSLQKPSSQCKSTLYMYKQPTGGEAQLAWKCLFALTFSTGKDLTSKVGQTDLVLACDQGSLVGLRVQYYKSLCAAVTIFPHRLTSRHRHRHTDRQHLTNLYE